MRISLLRQTLRSPLPAVTSGFRFWRAHGARVKRARVLCQCADGLRLRHPRDWERRAERLYRRAVVDLRGVVALDAAATGAGVTSPHDGAGGDPGVVAHRALAAARAPYRLGLVGLAAIGALVALGALVVVLIGSALSPALRGRVFPRDLAHGRPWTASSADPGYETEGVNPSTTRRPHFFHTTNSDHPWLQIDLGEEHLIRSVLVKNRADCCGERALPLNVEVFDGQSWQLIAQRRSPFSTWEHDVEPVRARLVRVRLAGFGFLHLKRISIYGQ